MLMCRVVRPLFSTWTLAYRHGGSCNVFKGADGRPPSTHLSPTLCVHGVYFCTTLTSLMAAYDPLINGIMYAIAYYLSMWYNLRRTEDATHPLWTIYLYYLCTTKHIGILLPTPQYRLHVSHPGVQPESESISAADGAVTAPLPRGSWEVIPDFCILLPKAKPRNPTRTTMARFLEKFGIVMSLGLVSYELDIISTLIPLLVELKHPVSRHPADIEGYIEELMKILRTAQIQVEAQAGCLFCVPKFRDNLEVMLIAAAGDWWSFKLFKREQCKLVFEPRNYSRLMHTRYNIVNPSNDDDDTLAAPNDIQQADVEQQTEERRAERIQRQAAERDARADERARRATNSEDYTKYRDFIVQAGGGPYTDKQLDEHEYLKARFHRGADRAAGVSFVETQSRTSSKLTDANTAQWSKPMRIGSDASDYYSSFIMQKLDRLVKKEMDDRTKWLL